MCGIAGRYHPQGLPENGEWAASVSHLLRHRGPDGEGFFTDPFCQLVHRRLAIVDLTSTGEQPMHNEDGSVHIVYNGEIYNYAPLREEMIQKGHTVQGTSDTEVLVHLYEEYGMDMLRRVHGIFAFALYDQRKHKLFLVRDRYGTKPLYYTQHEGQWLFASELKGVLAWHNLPRRLDHQAVYDFLSWGYIPEPATGFVGIHAAPKGSYLEIDTQGMRECNYYQPEPRPAFQGSLDEAVDEVGNRLQEAVRYQKMADVPVGSLLSGGIDSGLVTTAYARVTDHPFYTFTVGFPDAAYDETALAEKTAKALGTKHNVISLSDWRLDADQALDLLGHFDQPFSDTSLFAVNVVAKGIRESGLVCALSGDGGDEAFGGYAFYRHLTRLRMLSRLPEFSRSLALAGSRAVLGSRSPGAVRQLRRAVDIARSKTTGEFLAQIISYQTEPQKQTLVLPDARQGLQPVSRLYEPFHRGWGLEDLSGQLTAGMFDLLLPGDMLKKVDMMSMRNSVEIRVPILDETLIEFALQLPHARKATTSQNKLVLRGLAERWLPEDVTKARKRGFGIPLDVLAAQSLKDTIKDSLLSANARTRAFIDPKLVQQWVGWFSSGQNGYALELSREGLYQRLFFLLSLENWMQRYQLNW